MLVRRWRWRTYESCQRAHDELARTQSPDLCPESHVKFAGERFAALVEQLFGGNAATVFRGRRGPGQRRSGSHTCALPEPALDGDPVRVSGDRRARSARTHTPSKMP